MDRFEQTRRILASILVVLISAGWLVPVAAALSLLHALLFTPHLTGVASYDLLLTAFRMAWLAFWWVAIAVVAWSIVAALKIAKHPIHRISMTQAVLPRPSFVTLKPAAAKASPKRKVVKKKV